MHGALIDSELLANVYLAMTGGQTALFLDEETSSSKATNANQAGARITATSASHAAHDLIVLQAADDEVAAHNAMLEKIRKSGACVWDFD